MLGFARASRRIALLSGLQKTLGLGGEAFQRTNQLIRPYAQFVRLWDNGVQCGPEFLFRQWKRGPVCIGSKFTLLSY